jgi:hypothetical protein
MIGKTFGGDRDIYQALGYSRSVKMKEIKERYNRNGIASRVVSAPAVATWANAPTISDDENPDNVTPFEETWERLSTRLKVCQYMQRVDKLAAMGTYSILLIGTKGSLSSEAKRVGVDGVLYLAAYANDKVSIKDFENNPTNERFGLPTKYEIDIGELGKDGKRNANKQDVHWSRVIHVADDVIEDDLTGSPMLLKVWNYLDDLEKIVGGAGEAVWRLVDMGIQFDVDKDMELTPEDETALTDEIKDYLHGYQRYLRTKGITANPLGSEAPDPSGAFNAVISLIAGTTGIPQRILLGSERGQLASSQDRSSWSERINERRKNFAEPVILFPFIDRLISWGALPTPKDEKYMTVWPDLMTLTEIERANVARQTAVSIDRIGRQEFPVISVQEFRTHYLGLPAEISGLSDQEKERMEPKDPEDLDPDDEGEGDDEGKKKKEEKEEEEDE